VVHPFGLPVDLGKTVILAALKPAIHTTMRATALFLLLATLLALGGCGHKGPLYLPQPDQQQEK